MFLSGMGKLYFQLKLQKFKINMTEIIWPSGDCKPIFATSLTVSELSIRNKLDIFRDKDDLDWFTGAQYIDSEIGFVLIMRHDNNPYGLTVFYVDNKSLNEISINSIFSKFKILPKEANWRA